MDFRHSRGWAHVGVLAALAAAVVVWPVLAVTPGPSVRSSSAVVAGPEIPAVLQGDTWLRHHREDLMPYWDMPEALGVPLGNFPSFRGRAGELDPANPNRGLSTLARGVYGYSLAFMLTGEERYLTYAKAGLDWINTKARDPVYGGYFGELDAVGEPVDRFGNKDVFDLASLGLAYGMYYNVTRDPAAEADLLAVRDLLFDKYYDADTNRVKDSLSYDLAVEVDTNSNGGDITNLLVPGTAIYLPFTAVLSDPARRAQFAGDLRTLTQILIDRHKDKTATNGWWFWGRTLFMGNGSYGRAQTDFGHNIKSYEMIYNANKRFADRPWEGLSIDRETLMTRAWDGNAMRWNHQRRGNAGLILERDSAWWMHDEADQTLAALDLSNRFAFQSQLAQSAQTFLNVYVDRHPDFPMRETFARVSRVPADNDLRKSFFGKNMLHNNEHALIMYLHGRALEGRPAKLYYAFPEDEALSAVAKPYWFDAAREFRTATRELTTMPGHRLVEVDFSGLDAVPAPPFPAPDDTRPPVTVAALSRPPTDADWHNDDVTVSLAAADDEVGVKEVHVRVEAVGETVPDVAYIEPGDAFILPAFTTEGEYEVTFFAVDALGNTEPAQMLEIRIDRTSPGLSGLPTSCLIWPPNARMVHVADVVGSDDLSGVTSVEVSGSADEALGVGDIRIVEGSVDLRAARDGGGDGRVYTLVASVTDRAGNVVTGQAQCVVPHDRGATSPSEPRARSARRFCCVGTEPSNWQQLSSFCLFASKARLRCVSWATDVASPMMPLARGRKFTCITVVRRSCPSHKDADGWTNRVRGGTSVPV